MIVYTLEQRWKILRYYFESHGNVADCTDIGRREAPSAPYVRSCDRLTEDADFGNKKSSFQMKLILILAGM